MPLIPPISQPELTDGLCLVTGTGGVSLCWRSGDSLIEIAVLRDFGGGIELTRVSLLPGSHCFAVDGRIKLNE